MQFDLSVGSTECCHNDDRLRSGAVSADPLWVPARPNGALVGAHCAALSSGPVTVRRTSNAAGLRVIHVKLRDVTITSTIGTHEQRSSAVTMLHLSSRHPFPAQPPHGAEVETLKIVASGSAASDCSRTSIALATSGRAS